MVLKINNINHSPYFKRYSMLPQIKSGCFSQKALILICTYIAQLIYFNSSSSYNYYKLYEIDNYLATDTLVYRFYLIIWIFRIR